MFSSMVTSQYADVFIDSPAPNILLVVAAIVAVIGLVVIVIACFSYDFTSVSMIGSIILLVASMLTVVSAGISQYTQDTINRNIKANISEKYHAEVRSLTTEQTSNLDKYRSYALVFEDGSVGEYQIKFERSGEPVTGEKTQPPSASDLETTAKNK